MKSRKRKKGTKPSAPFEPLDRSVYVGRVHLGRYVQTARKKFEAFRADGRVLGRFWSAKATLAAIRNNSADARAAVK